MNKQTLCSGSWTPLRIRFQPFPVCHYDRFTDGKHQKKAPWHIMFAYDVVLYAREKDVLGLELEQWREAFEKRGMKVSRANTEYMSLNVIRKCSYAIRSVDTGRRISISGKHPAERWWHEYSDKQEDTVWMEQLGEDVWRPMRQDSTTIREGTYTQGDRSASYSVRDGDSASH